MMSNYQVIIVKEAQNLDKVENLEPYILNPLETTILVLCYKYEKIDRRKTLFKNIEKKASFSNQQRSMIIKIPDWISSYVRKMNYSISPKACFLLAEFLGNDISKIVNEISKLIINLSEKQEITEDDVEKNIGISKDTMYLNSKKPWTQRCSEIQPDH